MSREKIWHLVEQMEAALTQAGYLHDKNFSEKGSHLLKKSREYQDIGNIFTLVNGKAVNLCLERVSGREGGFLIKVKVNIPDTQKHFSDAFRRGLTQRPNETDAEFLKRFKDRIMELKLEMVFEKKENYQIECLVEETNRYMRSQGKKITRKEMVQKMMDTLGTDTEETLEQKLLELRGNFFQKGNEENLLLVFTKRLTPTEVFYEIELV